MAAELRLANTPITDLDPSLTKDVLYERFVNILNKNDVDEIGFLPFLSAAEETMLNLDQVPVYPFIVQERGTKLGIPVFCWVPLLDAAYAVLKDAGRATTRKETTGTEVTQEWWTDAKRRKRVLESTSCLMILCPDSFTAVNARKRLVQEGFLDPQKELQFLNMILTFPRNCKSSGAWYHRKWLICFMFKDHETVPLNPSFVEEQLKICHLAAERYPKCYYAWTMRHWLVEQLGRHWWIASVHSLYHGLSSSVDGDEDAQDIQGRLRPLLDEFETMKAYMQRNVSDHSTQQHLQQCMIQLSGRWIVQQSNDSHDTQQPPHPRSSVRPGGMVLQWTRRELELRREKINMAYGGRRKTSLDEILQADEIRLASFPWVVRLWVSELKRTRNLIRTYPGHESLWYHLRFVYYGLRWLECELGLDAAQNGVLTTMSVSEGRDQLFVSPAIEETFVEQLQQASKEETDGLGEDKEGQQKQWADNYLIFVRRLESIDAMANIGL